VQPGGLDVEELAVSCHVVHERAVQRRQRGVEGLQRAEGGDVDARDRPVLEPGAQVEGEGLDLGKLGHAASISSQPVADEQVQGGGKVLTRVVHMRTMSMCATHHRFQ
jgi:hypothetical protein